MSFLTALYEEASITLTENGAITYSSTLDSNLDFFALASAKRARPMEAVSLFKDAFFSNDILAILNLFHCRDIREGQGERNIFRECFLKLYEWNKDYFKKLLHFIPEYGRWDDLFHFLPHLSNTDQEYIVKHILMPQLTQDLETDNPSLLAKWIPLSNSVNSQKKKLESKIIQKYANMTERELRKIIVPLRQKIQLVEQKLSEKKVNEIEYSKIPSRAGFKYRKAFLRNDEIRYKGFLEKAKSGEVKINTQNINPYEIVSLIHQADMTQYRYPQKEIDLTAVPALWNNLPNYVQTGQNSICVIDTSASMKERIGAGLAEALDVSISLGIYMAERNTGFFKDHFITFSAVPKLVKLQGSDIIQRVQNIQKIVENTNFQAVFDLILQAIVNHNIPEQDQPSTIYVISDMEFDNCGGSTNFDQIKQKYKRANIKMPQMVFWNVCSRGQNVPVRKHENGTFLVSGFSPRIFSYVISNKADPVALMMDVLSTERYQPIYEALKN